MVDRIESSKDIAQEVVESTATHVGRIATIITRAVADVAREIGEIITDGFEMRDAARKARLDEERVSDLASSRAVDDLDDDGADLDDLDAEFDLEAAGEQPALPSAAPKAELEQD